MEIVQISASNDWFAMFDDKKTPFIPVAVWALVKYQDGTTSIKGMIPSKGQQFEFCENFDEFLSYIPKTELPE
jgi:hypothetical protein